MILIADSGSTKADWVFGSNSKPSGSFTTKGMNPFFHNQKFILDQLSANNEAIKIKDEVKALYFFGAGCSSVKRNDLIKTGLQSFFNNAHIIVEHDMLGCALSVCNGSPGIACILGTGSNIAYFDGSNISDSRHGLGYVLGDEGSGSYYGKKLLSQYLYGLMPEVLESKFRDDYKLNKESILNSIYHEPNPNVYLASFAKFLSNNSSHPYIKKLVGSGILEFFETNVLSYKESHTVPIHFVGSIAWHFKDVIYHSAERHNLVVGNIIQKPINGLADYFLNGGLMPK